jgi:cytochrome c6
MTKLVLTFGVVGVATLVAALLSPSVAGEDAETAALYNKKCSMCHGKNGVAKKMAEGSADLNDPAWQKSTSVGKIAQVLTEGKGKMPGYRDKLGEDEIKAIADYVLTLE